MGIFLQTGGNFNLLIKDVIAPSLKEEIILNVPNKITATISFRKITEKEIKRFKDERMLQLHKDQIILDIEAAGNGSANYMEETGLLSEWIIFSFILSLEDIDVIWDRQGERSEIEGTGGLGVGLPLSVFRLNEKGINFYYTNDVDKATIDGTYFIEYNEQQLGEFQKILVGRDKVGQFMLSALTNIHTVNWVKRGFFMPACVILFSCYELLLEKGGSGSISTLIKEKYPRFNITSKQVEVLDKFQFLRNAIAHPSNHKITTKGRVYTITKIKTDNEVVKTENFDVVEISEVRKILIQLIRTVYAL